MKLPTREDRSAPELRLLLHFCAEAPREPPEGVHALEEADVRRRFLALLRDNAVDGLVLGAMDRTGVLGRLGDDARSDLSPVLATLRRRAGVWVLERDRVLAQLRGHGLDPVVLKGAGLCSTHYPEPVARWFEDLDLLVDGDEAERAAEILADLGYEAPWTAAQRDAYLTHHYHLPLYHPGGFAVEVHWGLSRGVSAFPLDAAPFREEARRVDGLRVPRPEHLLLHVLAQSCADAVPRLVRLVDVDRILRRSPQLDLDHVAEAARTHGAEGILALLLESARRLLGTPGPRPGAPVVGADSLARRQLGLLPAEDVILSRRLASSWTTATFFSFWARRGWHRRIGYLRRRLRGENDPMAWIWEGRERPTARGPHRLGERIARLGKLAVLHWLLYRRRLTRGP